MPNKKAKSITTLRFGKTIDNYLKVLEHWKESQPTSIEKQLPSKPNENGIQSKPYVLKTPYP